MTVMTEATLRELCKTHDLYLTPAANEKLYANYCGFRELGGLEKYTELKCLFLEGNGLDSLAGLPHMPHLKCLYLQSNGMYNLEGLESAPGLHTLDVDQNFLETLEGVEAAPEPRKLLGLEAVPELRTLLAASNRFETLDDLRPLWGCRCLTTVDLRNNKLESEEGLLQLLQALPALRCLYLRGNEFVSRMRNYRKTLIAALPELTYLDDRPIFDTERRAALAWQRGGLEEERVERLRAIQEQQETARSNFETVQGMRRDIWRKRRASMGLSSGDADPFFDINKVPKTDSCNDDKEEEAEVEADADVFVQPCRKCTYEVCRCKSADDERLPPSDVQLPPEEEAKFQEMLQRDAEHQANEEESARQLAKLLEEDQWANMRPPEPQATPYSAYIKDEDLPAALRPASLKRKLQLDAQPGEGEAIDPEAPQTPPPQPKPQAAQQLADADMAASAAAAGEAAAAPAAVPDVPAAAAPEAAGPAPEAEPRCARWVTFAREPAAVASAALEDESADTEAQPSADTAVAANEPSRATAPPKESSVTKADEAEELLPEPKAPTGRRLRPAPKWQDNDMYEEPDADTTEEVEEIGAGSDDDVQGEDAAPAPVNQSRADAERLKNLQESQEMLDVLGAASSAMRMAWACPN